MGIGSRITIGLFVDWPESGSYQREILAGAHREAEARDINLLVLGCGDLGTNPAHDSPTSISYGYANSGKLDGAILLTGTLAPRGGSQRIVDKITRWGQIPIVSIGEPIEGIHSILTNNRDSLEQILEHLLGLHHYRNPVFVTGPTQSRDGMDRLEIFRQALAIHDIDDYEERIHYGHFSIADGIAAVKTFWDERKIQPDLAVCANDSMAFGLMFALNQRGIRVPQDLAVTGFDDLPFSPWCESPLTTVHQPFRESGSQAVALVCRLLGLTAPERKRVSDIILETSPIFRSSCGCPSPDLADPVSLHRTEVLHAIIGQETNQLFDFQLTNYAKITRESGALANNAQNEATLLSHLGIHNWYLSIWDQSRSLDAISRLHIAYESGRQLPLPAQGLGFTEQDIFAPGMGLSGRWTNILQVLSEANTPFGSLIMEYSPDFRSRYEAVRTRFSETIGSLRAALKLKQLNQALQEVSQKLETQSLTDEMTGQYNRRGFLTLGSRQIAYCRRQQETFGIYFIDLDGLKQINDRWGHEAGDMAISTFAQVLQGIFRETDLVARLGGDEFTVLTPNTNAADFPLIKQRLDAAITVANCSMAKPWKLAFSIGVAFSPPGDLTSLDGLMQQADQVLYQEKRRKKTNYTHTKKTSTTLS